MWPAWRRSNSATVKHLLLAPGLLLLESGGPRLDKRTLDTAGDFRSENGPGVQRPRNGLFPGLQHLIQLPPGLRVDQGVGVHKGLIHVATQEKSVGSAYILDDRVDYIQRRQLLSWGCLQNMIRNWPKGLQMKVSPTVRMWFSNTREMAIACSVFSFAMTVKLLIWNLSLVVRSSKEFL